MNTHIKIKNNIPAAGYNKRLIYSESRGLQRGCQTNGMKQERVNQKESKEGRDIKTADMESAIKGR